MRKILALFVLLLSVSLQSMAQMTDAQIVEYVKEHNDRGEDIKDIAFGLMRNGVSQEQLLRLRSQYQQMQDSGSSSTTVNSVSDNRLRTANGESEPDDKKKKAAKNARQANLTTGLMLEDVAYDDIEEEVEEDEFKLKIFGHDIFRSKKLTFEPNMNIATPANYVLGPGDELIIDVYGASQMNTQQQISPDGTITIDKIGPVSVSGMTVEQAQRQVWNSIGAHYQGSSIKVSVGQTRTITVNVLGEVTTPGTYVLSAFSTVFNALYLAGGVTDIGTMRNIKVIRNGRTISTVDVYEYITNGRLAGNVMLQDNDVISVGTYENFVEIIGKVKRPMIYEMKDNESLQSLLTLAGGFTGDAYKEKIRIERKSSEGLTVHNVDEFDFTSFHNVDGDVVVISPIIERYKNTATVKGAVFRPGSYKIGGSVNSVKTLVEQAGGLEEQAVTTRAVLHRMKSNRTLTTITVDLNGILQGNVADIPLQNEDELYIASVEVLNGSKFLNIAGAVLKPGRYPFSENETIEDLITEAGGLLEIASLDNVEVARRIVSSEDNPDGNQMAKVFTFKLDEGLTIEGGTGFVLMPYDHVTIHRNPDYQEQKSISVMGEVKYAGRYVLTNKEQRLSEVIKRAGGFTSNAYVEGAQLIRRQTKREIDLKRQLVEMTTTKGDSIAAAKQLKKTSYAIGIDLKKAIEAPGSLDDVILMEGDSIYVPKQNNVVKISGEVLHPNTVTFTKNKRGRYYLNQAGGVTETGKKRKTYIIYANGQVSMLRKGEILPGCEIVVPSKVEKRIDTSKISMWATLSSTIATVGAVISSIIRR